MTEKFKFTLGKVVYKPLWSTWQPSEAATAPGRSPSPVARLDTVEQAEGDVLSGALRRGDGAAP